MWRSPGTDDLGGPKASQISELRRTAKWHDPPEEVREEDDLLTREELKLFQSVEARFNFLAMDRPDLLCSVEELMRKMASPRTQDLTALKRVCTIHNQIPANDLQIPQEISSRKSSMLVCSFLSRCPEYLDFRRRTFAETRIVKAMAGQLVTIIVGFTFKSTFLSPVIDGRLQLP